MPFNNLYGMSLAFSPLVYSVFVQNFKEGEHKNDFKLITTESGINITTESGIFLTTEGD